MRVAIVTVSTSRAAGEANDESGPLLAKAVEKMAGTVVARELVTDDESRIRVQLISLADSGACDLILTTGGTGLAPSDRTPEATRAVLDREAPGIAEALRAASLEQTPHGMLSRGVAGVRGTTLIVNLPGSKRACEQGFALLAPVLDHAVGLLTEESSEH